MYYLWPAINKPGGQNNQAQNCWNMKRQHWNVDVVLKLDSPLQPLVALHRPVLPCRSIAGSYRQTGHWSSWRHLADVWAPHR